MAAHLAREHRLLPGDLVRAGARARGACSSSAGSSYAHGASRVGTVVAFALYLFSLFDPIARLGDWFSEFQSGRAALDEDRRRCSTTPVTVAGGTAPLPERGALRRRGVYVRATATEPVLQDVSLTVERASTSRSSARPAPGSRRSRSCSSARTTREGDASPSAASTCATPTSSRCAGGSSSCRRRGTCSPGRSPTTCGSRGRTRATRRSRALRGDRRARALRGAARTGWRPTCARAACACRRASGSSSSLARVALADPAVIVLDEATSSLDPQTEAAVESALAAVSQGRTVITIAHRLSTAERADRVAVMERGQDRRARDARRARRSRASATRSCGRRGRRARRPNRPPPRRAQRYDDDAFFRAKTQLAVRALARRVRGRSRPRQRPRSR